jgi:hypothetical protein
MLPEHVRLSVSTAVTVAGSLIAFELQPKADYRRGRAWRLCERRRRQIGGE